MATKTLGPQASCLQRRFRCETPASPRSCHVNYGFCSRRGMQSRNAVQAKKHHDGYPSRRLCNPSPGRKLVMGEVKILKRGMKISFDDEGFLVANPWDKNDNNINAEAKIEKDLDLMLESKDGSGQNHNEEAKIKKGLEVDSKVEKYYGPSFDISPCPSLVPMPTFQRPIFY
ncbi:hypothetical protein QN277_007084 [Acacia crassicarpa]|uniref:Uncharacterized protein n=1 Tax=Acacia crassicarpa TaxID=499986 RepID=A0AAE1IW92_9FABA|nr:hypothetical protein QN277_007080 [Acacia crassicarpa]KAK4257503.1 hypothetical protein QN277_007081 [Acacia crassicarpa]KAK4257505.1 hypothetical protein QN277_007083 [Acacia crassicarpa]KAK4257506.1 hypothetical protein QN277_007084 [Acacia crassicarpa]